MSFKDFSTAQNKPGKDGAADKAKAAAATVTPPAAKPAAPATKS